MNRKKTIIIDIFILLIILLIDQLTKSILINKNISIIPNFLELNYTQNTGVAFGVGNKNILIIIILNILVLGLIIKFIKENELNNKILIPLFMVLAGGISNLVDRVFRGYVVDFININLFNFPNFNIADISISIGILILFFVIIKKLLTK